MAETIEYQSGIIMDTLQHEVTRRLGADVWELLTKDIGVPDFKTDGEQGCAVTRELMKRLDAVADNETKKDILSHVRHGLKPEQFGWARRKFIACGQNIDRFIAQNYRDDVENFIRLRDTGEDFYGQPITPEVFDFIMETGIVTDQVRHGADIRITGFPFDMIRYIQETDERKKRYYACHCPFARESILAEEGLVSTTICYCSLGHAKLMWEAVLDTELDGEIVESVLGGDLLCKYVLHLTEDVMDRYLRE